jgi:hypothetical protein
MFNPAAATRIAKSSQARQLTFFLIMTIKMTNHGTSVEIQLDDDACMYEVANALRAMAYAIGYDINDVLEAIPPLDYV